MSHGYKYQNQNQTMGANMGQQMGQAQNPYYGGGNFGGSQQGMGMGMNQQFAGMHQAQNMGQNPYYGQNMGQNYGYGQNSSFLPKISLFGETPSDKLLRGLLIGGAAAYILTNENAQKAIIKTGVKLFGALAGGVEEFKEKIMDAKAEIEAEKEEAAE